ncbi:uncharacterized protein LOC126736135 [Anthonomus grandis grandis]|uniref:uncharacterized protein LOC126736135 n=1 Tax=Anthonomus grandis grandis TaxID=2921223 RepID=UPI0021654058|nr:uncharacterized protein LOC126736135 [Anthonomus grandis grandis]
MFDTDKFIISIQDQPVLWDKATKEYSNKDSREKAWVSCGAVMYENWEVMTAEERNKKVNDMKNKWRHVRDNFLKSLNRGKSGDPAMKMRKYIYADSLQFLLTTVDKRKTSGNIDTQDVEDNENSQQDEETPDDIAGSSRDPTLIQSPPEASLRPVISSDNSFSLSPLPSIAGETMPLKHEQEDVRQTP